jgi:SAM-dependent methyltransferase
MDDDVAASFRAAPEAYDNHVGRYGAELARGLIGLTGVTAGAAVLDVGCGTGLLAAELASVVGAANVAAMDPSEPFVTACRARIPGADVRVGRAEQIPFADNCFDAVLAQLVVNFMTDPPAGVREMRRVATPDGVVAAAVWDYAGEMTLLRTFWEAAGAVDLASARLAEGNIMRYCDPAALSELWVEAGLRDVAVTPLLPAASYSNFDDLWQPLLTGVAPSGAYVVSLDDSLRRALYDEWFGRLGHPCGPFVLTGRAWAVVGRR